MAIATAAPCLRGYNARRNAGRNIFQEDQRINGITYYKRDHVQRRDYVGA